MDHRQAVVELVEYRGTIRDLIAEIQSFNFDCKKPLVTLRVSHIIKVLSRYLDSEVSANDVASWAEAVEGRDDIAYDSTAEEQIAEALFQLSTSQINHAITRQIAERWIYELSAL